MKKVIATALFCILSSSLFCQNKVVINPSFGYAWRTAKKPVALSPAQADYYKKITQGLNFDIGAYYLVKPDWGLGLKFNQFQSSAVNKFQLLNSDNTFTNYNVATTDKITFIGPAVYGGNFSSPSKHKYNTGIAIGYLAYKNSFDRVDLKGSTVGVALDLGYQFQIVPKISIGPQLGFTGGTLSKFKFNGETIELPEDIKESLHRISIGLGANIKL